MQARTPRLQSNSVMAAALTGAAAFALFACRSTRQSVAPNQSGQSRVVALVQSWPGERHLRNIRQLTFGGENAEAYFSHDGKRLIFQSTRDGRTCDQQYVMNTDGR